ncbi:MAG: site-2 protease family protein [Paenibacillaceae bacterium]|jgi:Zn-dependent protease|nr:site-2 protease family protein [Paenibacillaceae bacterium]
MNNLTGFNFEHLPFLIVVVVLAFTLHEFSHAYAADRFGDPTPRSMGRVTLNPRSHLDLLGIILIAIVGFGWAKPVLIRSSFFKRPRLMSVIVSLVGPLSNLLLAFIGVFIAFLLSYFHAYDGMSIGVLRAVALFLQLHIMINLLLFIFNLLPLPPLDGYRILYEFFPYNLKVRMQVYEQYAFLIFLLFVLIDPVYERTLGPVLDLRWDVLALFNDFFTMIFGNQGQLAEIIVPLL